jgi:uncharacterized Rmd1/YagE family protein
MSDNEPQSPFVDAEGSAGVQAPSPTPPQPTPPEEKFAEVVFFEYGVVVFFGLPERHERDILEDIEKADIFKSRIAEIDWEVEEFHYIVCVIPEPSPTINFVQLTMFAFSMIPTLRTHAYTTTSLVSSPNIQRLMSITITLPALKSRSHLLKLSIAHALAQSTLLAHYETNAQRVLSSTLARSIPEQLAASGALQLRRHDALKLTGRLFKLRRDVNLVSNVLDVPELFWSEASLGELYDAVREYMEIKGRVQVLNEKLGVASDFVSFSFFFIGTKHEITDLLPRFYIVGCYP